MNQTNSDPVRLEKILRLREFEKNNKVHMNAVSGIMGYPQYTEIKTKELQGYGEGTKTPPIPDETEILSMKNQTTEAAFGFKVRLVFSSVVFFILLVDKYIFFQLPSWFYKEAQDSIQVDYSQGIIDFMKDIPYTLDYEKIGVKR